MKIRVFLSERLSRDLVRLKKRNIWHHLQYYIAACCTFYNKIPLALKKYVVFHFVINQIQIVY